MRKQKIKVILLALTMMLMSTNCTNANDVSHPTVETRLIEPFPFEVEETMHNIIIKETELHVETVTMYANCEAIIYDKPREDEGFIHDVSLVNTSFEVAKIGEKWSKITTSDGFAYVLTECLSEEPVPPYTEEEEIMAHLLAGECQPYPDDEQIRVGSVALNRVNHDEFPDTLEEVVFQPGQYACTWDGNYYREPTERNWANAEWLLTNGSVFPEYVIYQSRGKQGDGVYYKSDWHYFCY